MYSYIYFQVKRVTIGAPSVSKLITSCFQNSEDHCDSPSGPGLFGSELAGSGSSGSALAGAGPAESGLAGAGVARARSGCSDEYKGFTIAIQDDYSYWHAHNESDDSGKLLLINIDDINDYNNTDDKNIYNNHDDIDDNANNIIKSNSSNKIYNEKFKHDYDDANNDKNSDIIQIFFDDNIERNRAHIVDVRDIKTFKHIPFNKTKDVFIKKIEPYYAIIDENYYINLVHEMVENQ